MQSLYSRLTAGPDGGTSLAARSQDALTARAVAQLTPDLAGAVYCPSCGKRVALGDERRHAEMCPDLRRDVK